MFVHDVDLARLELRDTIRKHMARNGLNQSETAQRISVGRTGFTKAINGNHLFTVETLDKLMEVLGLEEGSLYPLFYGECVEQRTKTSSTIFIMDKFEKYLRRCLETGQISLALELLNMLLEYDPKKLDFVFQVAESIFQQAEKKYGSLPTYKESEYQQALALFDFYSQNETDFHSDKLAISYFRIYYMQRFNLSVSFEKLSILLTVIDRLPIREKIKAYDRVMTYYYISSDWVKTAHYAVELEKLAKGVDEDTYGYCLMIKSFAKKELGHYEEAMQLTAMYSSIPGFENLAYGNGLMIRIEKGDLEHVDAYLDWLDTMTHIESGLSIVLRKLLHNSNFSKAKLVVERFYGKIRLEYGVILYDKFGMRLQYSFALLHIGLQEYTKGIEYLLLAAKKALHLNLFQEIGTMLYTYEQVRQFATPEQQNTYLEILINWKEGK
ncbi:helix-turn-helix domain-containing protein [Brevibacillus sp. SYSU BS000544]|uniref:helix-turn-helix domain-containing protein n=1 Tax=Brevibacillus sp. SYSU BS000544 TaxID=3416443 RepID=UPI003CE59829